MILNKIVYGKCIYSRIEATVMLFMRSSDQLKFCAVFCKEIIAKIYRIYSRIEATVMLFMRSGDKFNFCDLFLQGAGKARNLEDSCTNFDGFL
jgi:hypothetical protein